MLNTKDNIIEHIENGIIKDNWYWCCQHRIQKTDNKTTIIGEIYCRYCKTKYNVVIANGILLQRISQKN